MFLIELVISSFAKSTKAEAELCIASAFVDFYSDILTSVNFCKVELASKIRIYLCKTQSNKMAFFDSEIVQHEARNLFQDYQSLTQLGGSYGKFDREGKILFIEKMEEMMDRYKIFMKRFELSDDFMAQMTLKQLENQLGNFGITPQQMFAQMNMTLEKMKSELELHN
jgi:hypothetical protein